MMMDTTIKMLRVGMGRSVKNLSLSQRHVNSSSMCSFGPHSDVNGVWWFLGEEEVAQAVVLLQNGYTQRTVAESFDVSGSVVARLWRRFQETGELTRREEQGRHQMTF